MAAVITLLTDFGLQDSYVAQMKGVILSLSPLSRLIDVSHHVPPQDIATAARMLREIVPAFPDGTIHVAVVDPGVGTSRRVVAAEIAAQFFVLPDNGLLSQVLQDYECHECVVVENQQFWRPAISATFHGRDIMAPVAAHVANGVCLAELGRPAGDLQRLADKHPSGGSLSPKQPRIVAIDHFGNVQLEGSFSPPAGSSLRLTGPLQAGNSDPKLQTQALRRLPCEGLRVPVVSTYGAAEPGELVLLRGSSGLWELAIVNGSAAKTYGLTVGDVLSLD